MKNTLYLLALTPFLLAFGCTDSPSTRTTSAARSEQAARTEKVEFLEFHADWCGPCRQQKPIVQALQAKYPNMTFRVLDVDDDKNLSLVKKYEVTSIPRMIILVDGKVEEDYLGLKSQDELTRGIEKAIAAADRLKAP